MNNPINDLDSNEEVVNHANFDPIPQNEVEPNKFFFMGAVKVIYLREDKVKEKTVNVLIELADSNIIKSTLNDLNQAAANRVINEGQLPSDAVKDIVTLGIWPLACCTRQHFHEHHAVMDTSERPAVA